MNTAWNKAFNDFWQEKARSAMVVLAISLGIAAFCAVLASYAIITRALNTGYLATNPAAATLRTDVVDDDLLRAVKALPGVGEAEARRTLSGRIKAGAGAQRTLVLFVVRDFADMRVSTIRAEAGKWPPARGEILIERDAFQVARARIGDDVEVRIGQGDAHTLHVAGSVQDVGQAQARMENMVYGYITIDTLALLGESPTLNQIKLRMAENGNDLTHIRAVVGDVKTLIEARGHAVERVDIPTPGEHPHAAIMGMLLLAMSGFGIFVLVLSAVLVVNLLTALMAAQVRQIGVMKAIGASRSQVAAIYYGQAGLLGVAAIVLALPFGLWGSRVLSRYLAVFLNFDIPDYTVPLWVYALVVLVGLLVPLLAAAWPVQKASAVSVREALADTGVPTRAFGVGAFDRAIAGVGGTTRPLLLALRNSFRRRARLIMTLTTLAIGGLVFISALNVRDSLAHTIDGLFDARHFDLSLTLANVVEKDKLERAVRDTPGITGAEAWITTQASIPHGDEPNPAAKAVGAESAAANHAGGGGVVAADKDRFSVVALPIGSRFLDFNVSAGRELQAGDTDAMVVNTALAALQPAFRPGNIVTLQMGHAMVKWQIVGVVREALSAPAAYVPLATFEAQPDLARRANSLRVALANNDPASIDRVRAALDRNLEAQGARVAGAMSKGENRFGFDQHMLMIYVFLVIMSCIVAGVGGLGLITTMSLNVLERRREMGVMRAIGASSVTVCMIVILEGMLVGFMSWLLAAVLAWPLRKIISHVLSMTLFRTELDFAFSASGLMVWLAVSLLLGAMASVLPAWHAARAPVCEALA